MGQNTLDLAAFLGKDQDEVEARLDKYVSAHPEVSTETTEILMMDVENPHPRDLHTYADDERYAIVAAYKTRIAAFKKTFPKAKLCMYGTLNPHGQGRPDGADYLARLAALREAGREGLYYQLDYLSVVPVLYPRFGPNDAVAAWTSYCAYTGQGIDGSRQLLKSNNTSLPVLPITGFRVANGKSGHHDELLLDLPVSDPLRSTMHVQLTLHVQLDVMTEKGILQVVFWVGEDSDLLGSPNPNGRTVTQHVCGR